MNHEIPWVIPEQTEVKLLILYRYLNTWSGILYNNQKRIKRPQSLIYFDGFSGPGIYWKDSKRNATIEGSPLIAAKIANKYIENDRNRSFQIFCIDEENDCLEILKPKMCEYNKYQQNWEVAHGNFNEAINKFIDRLERSRLKDSPIFCFIDPFGYSGYPISTIKRFLQLPYTEVFINFNIYDLIRRIEEGKTRDIFISLFGTDEFEKTCKFKIPEDRQKYLTYLYCKCLSDKAEAQYIMPFRINTPGMTRRPKYYLIHGSNHFKALKVMKDHMANISSSQYRFEALGKEANEITIFPIFEKDKFENDLIEHITLTKKITYDDLEKWAYINTVGISKTIKKAIVNLEIINKIIVDRKPRQRNNTVNSGAIIKAKG